MKTANRINRMLSLCIVPIISVEGQVFHNPGGFARYEAIYPRYAFNNAFDVIKHWIEKTVNQVQ